VAPDAVVQSRERLIVFLRREQKRRVGRDLERVSLQVVETLVHDENLAAQIAEGRPRKYNCKYHRRSGPSEP